MARPRASKSTIGRTPWDTVIPAPDDATHTNEPVPAGEERPRVRRKRRAAGVVAAAPAAEQAPTLAPLPTPAVDAAQPGGRGGRDKLTVHLDGAMVDRVKNAAYWNPRLTIARIAEAGIRLAIEEVERNNGGAYPRREAELLGGRPIK